MSTKTYKLMLLLIFTGLQLLSAIPVNELVPIQMMFPYRATEDGSRVVGHELSRLGAYMWTEQTGVINLGEGEAKDVSESHITVGTRKISNMDGSFYFVACLWDSLGNITDINAPDEIDPTGDGNYTDGFAISDDGEVIGGMYWTSGWDVKAFKWDWLTNFQSLTPEYSGSVIKSINADGSKCVCRITLENGMWKPVWWDNQNEIHFLDVPEDNDGELLGISPNGEYMAGFMDWSTFIYHNNTFVNVSYDDYDGTPGWQTVPAYINSNGTLVGVARNFGLGALKGFIYTEQNGIINGREFLVQKGVQIPEERDIKWISWISEDESIIIGTTDDLIGFIVKLQETNENDDQTINIPDYKLRNYPNPFNPSTTISYTIPQSSHVTVEVFNIKGQKISTLINENQSSGQHSIQWNAKNNDQQTVSSGIYFVKISSSFGNQMIKTLLMK